MPPTSTDRENPDEEPAATVQDDLEERVLIFAPLGRDGTLIAQSLQQAQMPSCLCRNLPELYRNIQAGAGAVLLTLEALQEMSLERFVALLKQQPPWSDLPILLLVSADVSSDMESSWQRLGNVTVLERPVRRPGLLSALRSALRARRRQYEVRELLQWAAQQQAHIEALNEQLLRSMTETHHRVKNNLQIIAAMIDLQIMEGEDRLPTAEFVRLSRQVRTLAVVHDLLTKQAKTEGQVQWISAREVLGNLLPLLEATAGERRLLVNLEDAAFSVRQGTSLALITNELVSNALKHGTGDVEVTFLTGEGTALLEVCDDGQGFPPGFDPARTETTGLGLVENLSRWDLQGTTRYENREQGGARIRIMIPLTPLPSG